MEGVHAKLPLTRHYIDSFPLRVFEITSAKPRTALGNSVIGAQGCEPTKDVPPSQPRSKCKASEKAGWVCAGQKCHRASSSGTAAGASGCSEQHLRVATQERGKPLLGNFSFWLIPGLSKQDPPPQVALENKDVAQWYSAVWAWQSSSFDPITKQTQCEWNMPVMRGREPRSGSREVA